MTTSVDIVIGTPYKSYIKTILGKVFVTALDPVTGEKTGVLLKGDPSKKADEAIVDTWDEKSDLYFRRANKRHFTTGMIREFTRTVVEEERQIEQYSDEELAEIINSKFLAFKATLDKTESIAVLYRMEKVASDLEKSDKILEVIRKRISEVQLQEYAPFEEKPKE